MTEAPDTQSVVPLSDEALARAIGEQAAAGCELLIVANGFTALAAARTDAARGWAEFGRGDFGLRSGAAANTVVDGGKLRWWEVEKSPGTYELSAETSVLGSAEFVDGWLREAEELTGAEGRGDPPKKDDMLYLGYLCGWRCQFAGCGKDLQRESQSGTRGNFSYFAHIIASSKKGPRGDQLLSGVRSNEIDNIMLMCDECHRRIDRVDPDRFTVDILRNMRQDSVNEVKRLLDTLRYEEALPIVVMGNITAQSPRFIQRDAEEAIWTRRLRMSVSGPQRYFYNGGHLHNPHVAHYWGSLFESLRDDIPLMRKRLNGTLSHEGNAVPLAIFPLHSTSMLVLAGRIVGEGSRVVVFQYDRDRPAHLPGGKWAFNENALPPAVDKYCIKELRPHAGEEEACLIVSLTFEIDPGRLPAELFRDGEFAIGALEVTATEPGSLRANIIGHPMDLDLLAVVIQQAVEKMQDEWKVKTVHLFVGAPASACFKIGQKLQARNHATYVCYETPPGSGSPFLPTIKITNSRVEELQSGESIALL
ncbi:SAVED domain-containing protein [Paraburkholderia sp. CNPSo 3076]|uniref:SAVED domain-containing protein n=1 Tax=Paraburkholderia sp. CNPSo 3076 TaxID=2940936 RepID=UPI00224CBA54|nr:SAVED domain-containing protein [Paraburkholderia sp. CNPSo 3076]MCX5545236.1 SAVED domain-containing protein [Paraburkholderia sp. CNPSo 3076]